jgi:hypothetical protein
MARKSRRYDQRTGEATMNIHRCRDNPCTDDDGTLCTATPEGIRLARKAIECLGHPSVVDYVALANAFTPKTEDGTPCHEYGDHEYLKFGTDITCDCVLQFVLQCCGYACADDGSLGPVGFRSCSFDCRAGSQSHHGVRFSTPP